VLPKLDKKTKVLFASLEEQRR